MRDTRPKQSILDYNKSFEKFGANAKSIYSIPHRTHALKVHLEQKFREAHESEKRLAEQYKRNAIRSRSNNNIQFSQIYKTDQFT